MQVIVDNLLINYLRQGKGRQLILLHGWADSSSGLSDLFKDLSRDFDVIAIDLPGFGGSQSPDGVWGLADFSSFLAKFIKKVGVKDIYGLIGHSNGGAIAIKALANNDLSANKLVLIASSGIRNTQKGRLGAIKIFTKTAKAISSPLPASTKKKLRHKLYDSIGSDLLAAEHMSESFKKVVAEDLRSPAAKLNLPTLLIYGEQDDVTPVEYGEMYHQLIDGSILEVVTGAGHFIQRDKPSVVVKLIQDFLC